MKVKFNILTLKVAAEYGRASVEVQPTEQLIYKLELPDDYVLSEDEGKSITLDGIRFVLANLAGSLSAKVEREF